MIGTCGFKGPPTDDGTVEIGYGVLPEFRRQGHATEAARGLIEHALAHPTVTRVKAGGVLRIDHVELFVPDRHEAARWYQRVLGLEIMAQYRRWAEDPGGPLMISSDRGDTKLALFEGDHRESGASAGFHRVAFRIDADGFVAFLRRLAKLGLKDHRDQAVTSDSVVDHEQAFSIYFCDPSGHRLELTTYDYEATRAALAELHGAAR